MAGKKTTKKADKVLEEKNEALTNETTETVESTEETVAENTEVNEAPTENDAPQEETPAESETEEEATEETPAEPEAPEAEEATEGTPAEPEAPEAEEATEGTPAEPEAEEDVEKELVDDETKELIGEVESVGKALEGDALTGPDAEQAISKELEHVDKLEKKLKEKVNEGEKNVRAKNERFTEFWCGVNNGWNS